jgi:hypothetical protein
LAETWMSGVPELSLITPNMAISKLKRRLISSTVSGQRAGSMTES